MKRKMIMLFATVLAMAFAVAAHGATGSSAWFFVDTTDGALKVSDVSSKYFDGEYGGGVGRQATFLSGVSCDIEMTILDDPVNVDHWLVNGQVVTTRRFTFDVGTLPVGGRLEVVAVGKNDGVRSKPFRANFDVAEVPSFYSGLLTLHAQKHPEEVVYGTFPLEIELELASSRAASIPALDWLPTKSVKVAPEISVRTEIGSNGNGSLRMVQVEYNEEKSKSFLGTQTRRPNGRFAEAAGVALGFNLTGGPLTATWDAKELRWKFNSVTFDVGISVEAETPPYYSPIGAYLTLSAIASISAQCKISGFGSQDRLEASLKLSSDQFPAVTVTGGVGEKNTINVEGSLSGEFPIELECNNGDWMGLRYGVRGTCRFTGQFLIFKAKLYEWHSPTIWFIDNTSPKSSRLMSSVPSDDIKWRLQPRDYLKKETPRMRLMSVAPTDGVVESGGYPNPAPSMASGTAGDALAYLRDNAERTSANRTELVLRTGTSNEWDVAEVVWDDGTADFMPEIVALPDGSFVATWANTGRTFSDDVTLPEMCGAMEIAVGVRNAATGEWSCRNLTTDSVLDFAPVVRASTNGTALVVWLRNAAGSLAGSAAEPTDIMASVYANGTWSAPTVVATGAVNGFDVAFDGENAVLAFSKDADGDLETMGDMEIFAVRFDSAAWGEPTRLTYAGDSDGRPLVRGGAGTGFAVLWTEKGVLMETAELAVSNAVAVAAADGWMISGGCSVLRGVDGRDALVWGGVSTAGGAADAPTAMMYDPVCGAWGAPRKLLDDGRCERQLAGAVGADGGIRIGYESSSVLTNAEGEVIFGDVELRTRYIPATCDLAVVEDGFSFTSEDLTNGDETVLIVNVENFGFRAATNATVAVYEGVGDEKIELASVVTNFPGGGIVAVNVPWTVDNTQSNLQFTVEIDAGGNEDEGADGNNIYVWNAGTYDVSFAGVAVRNESVTRRLLTATVSNVGLGPLQNGGKVVFRRGGENGEVLAVDEIGTVWPGTTGVYNADFAWDMEGVVFTSAWETICVQLFPDGVVGSALDATDMAFVQVMTIQDSDSDGLLDAQEQQIGSDPNISDSDGDGIGDGDEVNVTGTDPLTANVLLETPAVTASVDMDGDGVRLAWTAVDGASGYEVWRSSDGTAAGAEKLATVSALSWLDETANGEEYYMYFVRAVGYTGVSSLGKGVEGWRPTLFVAFDANGGDVNIEKIEVVVGTEVGILPVPTRKGYVFAGWYTDKTEGEQVLDFWLVSSDMTLYAHWTKLISLLNTGLDSEVWDETAINESNFDFMIPASEQLPFGTKVKINKITFASLNNSFTAWDTANNKSDPYFVRLNGVNSDKYVFEGTIASSTTTNDNAISYTFSTPCEVVVGRKYSAVEGNNIGGEGNGIALLYSNGKLVYGSGADRTSVRYVKSNDENSVMSTTTAKSLIGGDGWYPVYEIEAEIVSYEPPTYLQSISVNFTIGQSRSLITQVEFGMEGYAVPCAVWNNLVGTNGTLEAVSSCNAAGEAVSVPGVRLEVSGSRGYWSCSLLSSSSELRHGYVDDDKNNSTPTVTVSGIPFANYRVIVYHSTDTANAQFGYDTINGINYTYENGELKNGTASWGSAGASNNARPIEEGVNTLVSPVQTNSTLTVVGHRGDGNGVRGCIAAIQVVEVTLKPTIDGDDYAEVISDAEIGFVIKPSKENNAIVVSIPDGVEASNVTVEVAPTVDTVKPNGAAIKIVNADSDGGLHDITDYLSLPEAVEGVVNVGNATLDKEAVFAETTEGDNQDNVEAVLDAVMSEDASVEATVKSAKPGLYYSMEASNEVNFPDNAEKTKSGAATMAKSGTVTIAKPEKPEGEAVFYRIKVSKTAK